MVAACIYAITFTIRLVGWLITKLLHLLRFRSASTVAKTMSRVLGVSQANEKDFLEAATYGLPMLQAIAVKDNVAIAGVVDLRDQAMLMADAFESWYRGEFLHICGNAYIPVSEPANAWLKINEASEATLAEIYQHYLKLMDWLHSGNQRYPVITEEDKAMLRKERDLLGDLLDKEVAFRLNRPATDLANLRALLSWPRVIQYEALATSQRIQAAGNSVHGLLSSSIVDFRVRRALLQIRPQDIPSF